MPSESPRRVAGPLADAQRRTAVYGGELLVFTAVPAMRELCAYTDALARQALRVEQPARAQFTLDPDVYPARVAALRRGYPRDPRARQLFLDALTQVGVPLHRTSWDRLQLRVAAHDYDATALGVHRDTWGSNVYAQTNWWAPIYPITPQRGLAFYPDYWSRPLANDSAGWDLTEIRAARRRGVAVSLGPRPTEPVEQHGALVLAIEPGDLLCFSGAHLHAGVPNHTGLARFSIETRTVDVTDMAAGRGAPNLDGAAPRVATEWFAPAVPGDDPG